MSQPKSPQPAVAPAQKLPPLPQPELKTIPAADVSIMPDGLTSLRDEEIRDLFGSFRGESKTSVEQ
jgi:hypothetical protein